MLLFIIFTSLLISLLCGFFFLPLKILCQGNSLQTEIKLSILNFSFFKGILDHKNFSFETNFFKKKKVIALKIFLEKKISRFFKKKTVKTQPITSPNLRLKKKKSSFKVYKKNFNKIFKKNILSLLKKIVFSFKIKKLDILFSFEQTPYIGAFYRAKLCLPLKYRNSIHISFVEKFRYQLTSRVFIGKFLFSLFFWFLRMNFITFCYNNKK